jgi:hypothetical protein
MKIKIGILSFLFVAPLMIFAQGINKYQLKIPDNADKLFSLVKNDSNYIEYLQLMGAHAKSYENKVIADTITVKSRESLLFKAAQLMSGLRQTYPLWRQLSSKEQTHFRKRSAQYLKQLNGQSP